MILAPFIDRRDAGEALAGEVRRLDLHDPVVLALPRGGVPVAFEVARVLCAPLDILLVRKIGAPGRREYGIGALVDGTPPQLVLDDLAVRRAGASRAYLDREVAREREEMDRRRAAYRSGPPVGLRGKTAVVVDDGIATGSTVRAAMRGLAGAGCSRIVLAVPVAPRDVASALRPFCDEIVCLHSPEPFHAVGAHYRDFTQTSDAEIVQLLEASKRFAGPAAATHAAASFQISKE